jgi:hypothetical protein
MPTPIFPSTLSTGPMQDSAKFSVEHEDPAIQSTMDGGYVVSRPRHTRRPRRTWMSGFTYIQDADKAQLETFWQTVMGGSLIFQWKNPHDLADYLVRFKGPLKFTYVGKRANRRWDISFSVEEA